MEKGLDGEQVVGSSGVIDELLVDISLKTMCKGRSATGKRYVSGPRPHEERAACSTTLELRNADR